MTTSVVAENRLSEFSDRFHGDLLRPGTDDYESARKVWNGMIDRRPACIARCRSVADVQQAIHFARANDLAIAVRGGGHNAAGLSVCDDGLVIDLGPMRDVVVDPVARTARAGGGATWADFDRATAAHGLATTGGAVSSTGIAGLTLGGGLGWLMRSYGMACDNMIGADVVTVDGDLVHASATENADLFWGLRGGGGNFGIVTTFEFALHSVSTIFGGMLLYPLARARDVLRLYRDVTQSAPDALTVFAAMMHSPTGCRSSHSSSATMGHLKTASARSKDFARSKRQSSTRSVRCRTRRFKPCWTADFRRACRCIGARNSSRPFPTR
jgi:FAD/FMN-containing dehydrogenases